VASSETNAAVTNTTLFRLGSTTKMFVALAALGLVDAGKLRLDAPIGAVVPGLDPALQKLTLEQLLTHTAGLADEAPMSGPRDESALHVRVTGWKDDRLLGPPGAVFSYANPGYVLVGDAIAQITGKPFSAAMESLVLGPMGMRDSTFSPLVALTHPLALGHDGTGVIRPFAEDASNYPPGSLFTNADDLGRFFAALPAAAFDRLAQPRVAIPAQDRSYGYGLMIDERRGVRLVLHTGARAGYGSTFMFLPTAHVAVAVLANKTGATLSSAAFEAIGEYATIGELPEARHDGAAPSEHEIASLAGTYTNGRALPSVTLVVEGDHLAVAAGGRTLPAVSIGPDRFHVEGGAQLETFTIVRDSKGAPLYLCAETWALRKRS
jgi:CubicO group peptidase (beta-lactamase class C family)